MPLDFNSIFPMEDVSSARLMKLKAFCLFRAGVLSEKEMNELREKADGLCRTRFTPRSIPAAPPDFLTTFASFGTRCGTPSAAQRARCGGTTGFALGCPIVFAFFLPHSR